MKTEAPTSLLLLIVAAILISCASTRSHLDLAKANSKPGLNIHGARLGIMPLQCYPAHIGNMISDTIGNYLIGSEIKVIQRAYLAKILEEQAINLTETAGDLDYCRIGKICNVEYLLVGKVTVSTIHKQYVRPGRMAFAVMGATVQIVSVTTGEVVARASIERPRWKKWHQPAIIGEALAAAIKKELGGEK